jgi:hypothetical protein
MATLGSLLTHSIGKMLMYWLMGPGAAKGGMGIGFVPKLADELDTADTPSGAATPAAGSTGAGVTSGGGASAAAHHHAGLGGDGIGFELAATQTPRDSIDAADKLPPGMAEAGLGPGPAASGAVMGKGPGRYHHQPSSGSTSNLGSPTPLLTAVSTGDDTPSSSPSPPLAPLAHITPAVGAGDSGRARQRSLASQRDSVEVPSYRL